MLKEWCYRLLYSEVFLMKYNDLIFYIFGGPKFKFLDWFRVTYHLFFISCKAMKSIILNLKKDYFQVFPTIQMNYMNKLYFRNLNP